MCKGFCGHCDRGLGREDEVIACEGCGRAICEKCVSSWEAYQSPVDGAVFCRACVTDFTEVLARLSRDRTAGEGSKAPRLVVADL